MSDGTATWTYTYGADGLRTQRTNGTKTYSYVYNGGTLSKMTVGSDALTFTYDASGRPLSVALNGTTYYYATNLQGDVTAILNASGTAVVNYTYDAWGNPITTTGTLATTLGTLNPLRYRGYVYDTEAGLYYLQSRYYDPEVGRFINADAFTSTGQGLLGGNMFSYCGNNPVNRCDTSGTLWQLLVVAMICVPLLVGCADDSGPYSGQENCYAYALKLEYDPRTDKPFEKKPDPGVFSGDPLNRGDIWGDPGTASMNIEEKILADSNSLNFYFRRVESADHVPEKGNWLIAVALFPDPSNPDYHFWRKDEDGTWSHKPGAVNVKYVDSSGNTIFDPFLCDRGRYSYFIGYYEVGPIK